MLFGGLTVAASGMYAVGAVLARLIWGPSPQGFTTLIVAIVFLSGVKMISLGVIGEYLGRVYEEVKGRPIYIVSGVVGGAMDREHVQVYSEIYEGYWWWRAREKLLLDLIHRRCPEGRRRDAVSRDGASGKGVRDQHRAGRFSRHPRLAERR